MKILSQKILWEGRFMRVVGKEFQTEEGYRGLWEAIERTNSKEIVCIFALTPDKELIMTKQFRIPINSFVLELPAGLSDKTGEALEDTARRELLEETGYRADKFIKIQEGPFNSGMSNCVMAVYFAPDAKYAGFSAAAKDDAEEIEVVKMPLNRLTDFCANQHDGFMVDIKILGALKILEAKNLL